MDKDEALRRRRAREKRWRENNPDKLKEQRENWNKARRDKYAVMAQDPAYIEAKAQREQERRRKLKENWAERRKTLVRKKPKTPKQYMSPEQYAAYLEKCREKAKLKRDIKRASITEEERQRHWVRWREKIVKANRERARLERLKREQEAPREKKPPVVRVKQEKPKVVQPVRKPGRLLSLMGWRGW
jgi:hypothetical protein